MVSKDKQILIIGGIAAVGIGAAAFIVNEVRKEAPGPSPEPPTDPEPGPTPEPPTIPTPPIEILNVSVNPSTGIKPLSVGFFVSSSIVPTLVTYDFGDGRIETGSVSKSHTYFSAGSFSGLITVEDSKGNKDTIPFLVQVMPDQPDDPTTPSKDIISNFFQADSIIQQNQSVSFSISLAQPFSSIKEIRWHWGDNTPDLVGRSNSILSVDHTYSKPGIFNGKVSGVLFDGTKEERNFVVTVLEDPLSKLEVKIVLGGFFGTTIEINELFDAQAITSFGQQPFNVNWDMGDGTKLSGLLISHKYSSPGNYTVKVNVVDSRGNIVTDSVVIPVQSPPLKVGDLQFVKRAGDIKLDLYDSKFVSGTQTDLLLTANVENFRTDLNVRGFIKTVVKNGKGETVITHTTSIISFPAGKVAIVNQTIGRINLFDGPFIITSDLNASLPFLAQDLDVFSATF